MDVLLRSLEVRQARGRASVGRTKLSVPEYMVKGGETYRIVTDHLGSVRRVVDAATGAVAQRIDYDAWGNVGGRDTQPARGHELFRTSRSGAVLQDAQRGDLLT
jgi:hypothetical protein